MGKPMAVRWVGLLADQRAAKKVASMGRPMAEQRAAKKAASMGRPMAEQTAAHWVV